MILANVDYYHSFCVVHYVIMCLTEHRVITNIVTIEFVAYSLVYTENVVLVKAIDYN